MLLQLTYARDSATKIEKNSGSANIKNNPETLCKSDASTKYIEQQTTCLFLFSSQDKHG